MFTILCQAVEAAASVARFGAVAISVAAASSSSPSLVMLSPSTGSTCGCGKYQGIPIAYEWFLWHAVILSAGESVCDVNGVDVSAFREAVLDP